MGAARSSFIASLGASAFTSGLMLLDRFILNFIPLYFWGANIAGLWIVIKSWGFLLMSLEGGYPGKLSKSLACFDETASLDDVDEVIKRALFSSLLWGSGIFFLNVAFISCLVFLGFDFFGFDIGSISYDVGLMGFYAILYYQTQTILYAFRGVNRIAYGQRVINFSKLIEVCVLAVIPMYGGITMCIFALIFIRFVCVVVSGVLLKRAKKVRFAKVKPSSIEKNISEQKNSVSLNHWLAYFLYPLYPALYNFLPFAYISIFVSAAAVVQYSVVKLLGRLIVQLSQVLSRVLWPELLHKKADELSQFESKILKSFLIITLPMLILILVLSSYLDGRSFNGVSFDSTLAIILSLAAFLMAYNDVLLSIFISDERHFLPLVIRSLGLVFSLTLMFFLRVDGLFLIALILLILEICVSILMTISYKVSGN